MPIQPFVQSDKFLIDCVKNFFSDYYERPKIIENEEVFESLKWIPSIHFKPNRFLTIIAEVSPEKVYPKTLKFHHADLLNLQCLISIFCVCPEENYLKRGNQTEIMDLRKDGYGLITINSEGLGTRQFGCIPLIQHISEEEFKGEISDKNLPRNIKIALKDAFLIYQNGADSGLQKLTEIAEAIVIDACKKSIRKGYLDNKLIKNKTTEILEKMDETDKFKDAIASIGGMRSYLKYYRNPSHHAPKSRKEAIDKHRECKHGFCEGIKVIKRFRFAMKQVGIQTSI
ncbi:MAG: hypothetical protein JXI43_10890 [Tissierellales bacterium]|nr:hypothetical protein [Tissierellales bacterium]